MCYLVFTLTSNSKLNPIKPYNAGVKMKYRGDRATGIAFRDRNANITRIIKTKGDITNLKKVFENMNTDRILIHGRLPTTGDWRVAHPFLDRDRQIILIHNGGWSNYSGAKIVLNAFGYPVKHGVDSEVIAYIIGALINKEKGKFLKRLEKAVLKVFDEVDFHGFIWVTDKSMRVFYGLSKHGDNALWLTEELVAMASTKAGLKEIVGEVPNDEIKTLSHGVIKVWKKGNKVEWEVLEGELETHNEFGGGYYGYGYYSWGWYYDPEREDWVRVTKKDDDREEKKSTKTYSLTPKKNKKELLINADVSIYDGRLVCDYHNLGYCTVPKAYVKTIRSKLPKWYLEGPEGSAVVEYVISALDLIDETDVLDLVLDVAVSYDEAKEDYLIALFESIFHYIVNTTTQATEKEIESQ